MRILTSLLFVFVFFISHSQEITVLDSSTGQPLFNVAIFNEDKSQSTLTGFHGKADLSIFSLKEILHFRHVSHLEFQSTKEEILKRGKQVHLEPSNNELQEVVLSVTKFQQKKEDIPQKVVSLSRDDVVFANPQTSADLLESSGQVFVQKSQMGGGSPMIRGFSTNRLLITVDGVRMNTAIFRGGNVQNVISIDPLSIERTEVVLGPGSVIYGSDAVGGVMNFHTINPGFAMNGNTRISGNAYARHATANDEKTGHVDVNIGTEKWAFLTSATFSDFGDLRMGSHGPEKYLRPEYVVRENGRDIVVPNEDPRVQAPTGYDQINVLQKIRFMPSREWDFGVGIMYSTTSDFPRYDRLYRKRNGQLRSAEWYYGPQEWLQTNFQAHKKGNGVLFDEAKFIAAYQYFAESRHDRDFQDIILYENEEQVDAWSASLDFEKRFTRSTFYYGVEYVLNEVGSHGRETDILTGQTQRGSSRYPDDSSWQSFAAYGSFQWKINPDLSFQTGGRYNFIALDASFEDPVYDFPFSNASIRTGAFTGNAGINWQQSSVMGWHLNVSTAFRAPNIDDVGKIFDSAPGMVVVPNPNLKPEYAYNFEAGNRMSFGIFELDLTAYYTLLENAMVRRNFSLDGETVIEYQGEPSRIQAIQNASNAFVYGMEAGAKIQLLKSLKLVSQISITEGKEEEENGALVPLRHAAPVFGNTHLVWQKNKLKLDFFAEYNGELSFDELAPSEQDKAYLYAVDEQGRPYSPGWYTLNITSQLEIAENWLATASLENITDQRYRTYSSGIAAAGRNLILALKYSF